MKKENLTFEQKRKQVYNLRAVIHLGDIAEQLKISQSLLSLIISGERTDTCNAIETCLIAIETEINKEN